MQIVICDDLVAERDTLREHIHHCACELALDYVIEEFESVEALLVAVKAEKLLPDLLFMDIYMGGMTGMDAAKLLKDEGSHGAVIFTTTSESHAVQGFEMMADGYLVKPYSRESFRRSFQRAVQSYSESFKTISFLCDRLELRVFLKDLEYIEAAGRGSVLHAKAETLRTTKSVTEFATQLAGEEQFLQCHRGCIVNLNFVERVAEDHVLMKSGEKAPLALHSCKATQKAAADYFFLKIRGT